MADNNNPNLTPEEVAALAQSKDPRDQALLSKLNPTEHGFLEQWIMKNPDGMGKVNTSNPFEMSGGFIGKMLPESALPTALGAAKSVLKSPIVQGGIGVGLAQLPQIPASLRPILEMMGVMRGMSGGHGESAPNKPVGITTPPMSEAEYMSANGGRPRGVAPVPPTMPREMPPNMGRPNLDQTRTFGQATENMRQGGARVEGVTPPPNRDVGVKFATKAEMDAAGPAPSRLQFGGPMVEGALRDVNLPGHQLPITSRLRNKDGSTTGGAKVEGPSQRLSDRYPGSDLRTSASRQSGPSSNFRKEEFPPNTSNKTDPAKFKEAADKSANKQVPSKDVNDVQKKIKSSLRTPK